MVGAELDVEVARPDVMICAEEADVAVAIVVPLLEVVSDASDEAEVAEEPEAVVKETVAELVGLTTAVELTALEISVEPDVGETVTLVGAVVGEVVTEAIVLLLVGGTTVVMPVSLLTGGAEVMEVTTLDAEIAELVGVTLLPTSVVVTGTELLVVPKMLEMMLPRSVVGLDVESGASEVVVERGTPVEADPDTPEVTVGAELETTDEAGSTDEATEDAESVEVTKDAESVAATEDTESVEVDATVDTTDEASEASEETTDDTGSAVDVGADEATLESVALTETAESVADVFDTIESVPVAETAEDATLEMPVVDGAEELVGEAIEESSELRLDTIELKKDGTNATLVEPAAAVDPPVPVNEIPDVVVAAAVDPPVPAKEIPEETALSELETVAAVDPPVPVKETPDVSVVGVAVTESEEVEDDPKTPPGPKVIALPELEADDVAVESSLVVELTVGETIVAGTDPVDATEADEAVGEITTSGTDPVDATEETAEVWESALDEGVGETTTSGMVPVDATDAAEDTESLDDETVG